MDRVCNVIHYLFIHIRNLSMKNVTSNSMVDKNDAHMTVSMCSIYLYAQGRDNLILITTITNNASLEKIKVMNFKIKVQENFV